MKSYKGIEESVQSISYRSAEENEENTLEVAPDKLIMTIF